MNEVSKIVMLAVDELKPYERNARRHGEEDVAAIAESIREFGFNDPIGIWGKDNLIVEGHGRLEAAKSLGMEKVPCIRLDHLTDKQRRAYALAHNRTAELSEWDDRLLAMELGELPELDLGFFNVDIKQDAFFERKELDGDAHEDGNEEYNDFVDKFKDPKTTDDCYTPENIYEVIAAYVEKKYGVKRTRFMRPFFPGGDYEAEVYGKGAVVVDNPPFSILAEIIDFYVVNNVRFFLFAPGLAALNYVNRKGVAAICTYAGITYENGASVTTSFVTNLEAEDVAALSDPELAADIDKTNEENEAAMRHSVPKYDYPLNVLTAAKMGYLSKYGQALTIKRSDGIFIRALDAQKDEGKGIYGGALLLSEKAAAEKAAAEKAAAEKAAAEKAAATKWPLSDRELEIVRSLGHEQE